MSHSVWLCSVAGKHPVIIIYFTWKILTDKYRRVSQNIRYYADGGQGHGVAGRSSSTSEAAHRALKYSDKQHEQGLEPIHQKLHSHFRSRSAGRDGELTSPPVGRKTDVYAVTGRERGIGDPSCESYRRCRVTLTSSRVPLARGIQFYR